MKKTLCLLLALIMMFGLCACGGSAAAQPAASAGGDGTDTAEPAQEEGAAEPEEGTETEQEPEKVYTRQERNVLVRKTVFGIRVLPFELIPSEFSGRVFDHVTDYVYDEYGELKEEKESLACPDLPALFRENGEEIDGYGYTYNEDGEPEEVTFGGTVCHFEDGRVVWREEYTQSTKDEDVRYFYGSSGQLTREERTTYGFRSWGISYDPPLINNYDFDENGYITRWEHVENDVPYEAQYTWDEDGNILKLLILQDGEEADSQEIRYENGVQTSMTRKRDGETVDYVFSYNEEGLPAQISYEVYGKHMDIRFAYNEDGYLASADWVEDGVSQGKTTYTYSTDEDGDVRCRINGDLGPAVFGVGTIECEAFSNGIYDKRGRPGLTYEYELKPVLNSIQYVKKSTDFDYGRIEVLAEASPESVLAADSADAFYPELKDTLYGSPVPTPDGSRKLTRVMMTDGTNIPVTATMLYAEDGSFSGAATIFDGVAAFEDRRYDERAEADEQGRLILDDDPGRWAGQAFTYEYAEDGSSYTMTTTSGDQSREQVFVLSEYQITDWVKKTTEELFSGRSGFRAEYDEEGFPVYIDLGYEINGVEQTLEIRYYWETGAAKWVNGVREEGCTCLVQEITPVGREPYPLDRMIFDSHGYLVSYNVLYSYGAPTFTYLYE